jgi:hypothetical protein
MEEHVGRISFHIMANYPTDLPWSNWLGQVSEEMDNRAYPENVGSRLEHVGTQEWDSAR